MYVVHHFKQLLNECLCVREFTRYFYERASQSISSESSSSATPTKVDRPRSLSLFSEDEQKQQSAADDEVIVVETVDVVESSAAPNPPPPSAEIEESAPNIEKSSSPNASIKSSPSCSQEVAGNQSGHLDLKFYHSPLW